MGKPPALKGQRCAQPTHRKQEAGGGEPSLKIENQFSVSADCARARIYAKKISMFSLTTY